MKKLATITYKAVAIAASAALLLGGVTIAQPQSANAADSQTLTPGKPITVQLGDDSAKSFTAIMPKSGYIDFSITPICAESAEWNDRIYVVIKTAHNNKTYQNALAYPDRGTRKTNRFAFAPGTKLILTIKQDSIWTTDPKLKCTVKLNSVKPKRFESENNNIKKKADKLTAGKAISGITMKDDTDWFVFKAPKTGKYKIWGTGFAISEPDTDIGYVTSKVYKGSKSLDERRLQDGYGAVNLFSGKLKKGKKVHIKVSDGYDNFAYKLKVKRVK